MSHTSVSDTVQRLVFLRERFSQHGRLTSSDFKPNCIMNSKHVNDADFHGDLISKFCQTLHCSHCFSISVQNVMSSETARYLLYVNNKDEEVGNKLLSYNTPQVNYILQYKNCFTNMIRLSCRRFYCNNETPCFQDLLLAGRVPTLMLTCTKVYSQLLFSSYASTVLIQSRIEHHLNCLKVFHLGHLPCSFHVSIERRDVLPLVHRTSRNINCTERSCKITVPRKS